MRLRSLLLLPLLAATTALVDCGGSVVDLGGPLGSDSSAQSADAFIGPRINKASKVDILLVVDDSNGMAPAAELLARSLRPLLARVAAARDVHLGVLTPSVGPVDRHACPHATWGARRGYLHTTGPDGRTVTGPEGFLAATPTSDLDQLISDAEALVRGVGENGCGLEAQLESVYRFLAAPDPWDHVAVDAHNRAMPVGHDVELIRQRAAFLRPDSLLVVLMLTDEDDSFADPLSLDGQGWAFMSHEFPGSTTARPDGGGTTAARATSVCGIDPLSPDCTSCGYKDLCDPSTPECQKLRRDPHCNLTLGYYGPAEDPLTVRFHRMKERFGVDPQFPLSRYERALSLPRVPHVAEEHPTSVDETGWRHVAPYDVSAKSCDNPIFATNLPSQIGNESCRLTPGVRSPELVLFALIGGVPRELADTPTPNWTAILGANPDAHDYTGIDPHMIQSVHPRPGLPGPSSVRGDNGPDPVHGREWDTDGQDLQFACTFELPAPLREGRPDSDCRNSSGNPPLCDADDPTLQIRGAAYPSVRPLRLAKALGEQAVIGSVCASSPDTAYKPFMERLADKMIERLLLP